MDGTHYRAVLLDLDNTVYAYNPCHESGLSRASAMAYSLHAAWKKADTFLADYKAARSGAKPKGASQASSHCRLLYFKRMVEARIGRTDLHACRRLHEAYWQGYFSAMRPDAGCAEWLRSLRAQGVKIAWVTNFTTERQMLKLEAMRFSQAADLLVTSEEAGAEKPDPAPFQLALKGLGVSAREALFIGDEIDSDYRTARRLGMGAIWFNRERTVVPKDIQQAAETWQQVAALWLREAGPRRAAG